MQMPAQDHLTYANLDDPFMRRCVIKVVEKVTGRPKVQRLYDDYLETQAADDDFWGSAVRYLDLTVRHDRRALSAIPKEGPVILIANHPFGVLDGIAAGYLLSRVRQDVQIIAHASLGQASVFRPFLIPISFEGESSALRQNVASKRKALAHLGAGGSLILFPAGAVSTAQKTFGTATDAPWKIFCAKLIESANATVVPVYFEGQNGSMFHFVSKFSGALREALIIREVAKRIGGEITARIGDPIEAQTLKGFSDRQAVLDHLRDVVYGLRDPGNA